ncbi:hypothetical protein SynROS8604_01708 [Synechococcus sp. ROS8604]|nr:hypothetical protein SynROS8604_01708 [Synechococcus sp. ROS8604]
MVFIGSGDKGLIGWLPHLKRWKSDAITTIQSRILPETQYGS